MFKNVTGQKIRVFAFNITTGAAVTGDAANITGKVAIDHAAAGAITDTNPAEVEDGYYLFDLTQAETNGDVLDFYPESSTGSVQVIGVPGTVYTVPPNFTTLGIEADGDLTKVNTLDGHTAQTADHTAGIADIPTVAEFNARTLVAASYFDPAADTVANVTTVGTTTTNTDMRGTDNAATEAKQDVIDTNVDAILVDTGTTLDAKIDTLDTNVDAILVDTGTTLPASLATIDTNVDAVLVDTGTTLPASIATIDGNVDAILVDTGTTLPARFDGVEGATFSTATDSLEAIRNQGDSAWPTATGFSTHSAANVRTEMDSNSTQLAAIVADTNELQTDLTDGGRLDLLIDSILTDTGTTLPAQITALNDISTADVNAQVLDVLNTDTITLPGQTAPPLAPTHREAISWLYKVLRNRTSQTATTWSVYADNESTVDAKATVSDDGTTAIKQEIVTGP